MKALRVKRPGVLIYTPQRTLMVGWHFTSPDGKMPNTEEITAAVLAYVTESCDVPVDKPAGADTERELRAALRAMKGEKA